MKTNLLVFAVLAVILAAPVLADSWIPALSFPMLSERENTVQAGITQLVDFSSRPTGSSENVYNGGNLKLVRESYGLFDDLSYCRVDPFIARIKPERLKEIHTAISAGSDPAPVSGMLYTDGAKVIICPDELERGHYVLVTNVKHDASSRERSGILATIGQLFGIKKRDRITNTDSVAMLFVVIDADCWIEMFAKWSCGVDDPCDLNSEQIQVLRAAFFEDVLARTRPVDSTSPTPSFQLLADGYARRSQGVSAAFQEGLSQLQQEPDAGNGENAQLPEQLAQERREADIARRAADDAEQRRIDAERQQQTAQEAATVLVHEATLWHHRLREKYAGRTGLVFVRVNMEGMPIEGVYQLHLWHVTPTSGSWKENSQSPFTITDNCGELLWETGKCPYQWLVVGATLSRNTLPTGAVTLPQDGVRIIAIRERGDCYEVQ